MIEQAVSLSVVVLIALVATGLARRLIARLPPPLRTALADPVPFLLATFAVYAYTRDVPEFPPARAWEWIVWWPVALSIGCVVVRPIAAGLARRATRSVGSEAAASATAGGAADLAAWSLLWSAASVALLAVLWPLYAPHIAVLVSIAFVLWGLLADAAALRSGRRWRWALLLDGVAPLLGCAVVAFAAGFAGAALVAISAAVLAASHLFSSARDAERATLLRSAALGLAGLLTIAAYVYTEGLTAIPPACFVLLLAAPAVGALVHRGVSLVGGARPRAGDRWALLLGGAAQLTALLVAVAWASWEWNQISGEL